MGAECIDKLRQFCKQVGGDFEKKRDTVAVCMLPKGKTGKLRASESELVFSVGNASFRVVCEGGFSKFGGKRQDGVRKIELEVLDKGCKFQFE